VRHARTAGNGPTSVNDMLKMYTPNKRFKLKIRTAASDALFSVGGDRTWNLWKQPSSEMWTPQAKPETSRTCLRMVWIAGDII
jgi:hypothetical protein